MDEDGKLGRITQEEDGGIIEHPVPVILLSVELHGETTGVASTVCRVILATNGREAGRHLGLFTNALEHAIMVCKKLCELGWL